MSRLHYCEYLAWLQELKCLNIVAVRYSNLEEIPEELAGLPALTSLNLLGNNFWDTDEWPWWPTALSR
jgi:hypothetical protein